VSASTRGRRRRLCSLTRFSVAVRSACPRREYLRRRTDFGVAITNKVLADARKRALMVSRIAPAIEWKVTTPLLSLGNPEERDPPSPRLLRGSVDLVCLIHDRLRCGVTGTSIEFDVLLARTENARAIGGGATRNGK